MSTGDPNPSRNVFSSAKGVRGRGTLEVVMRGPPEHPKHFDPWEGRDQPPWIPPKDMQMPQMPITITVKIGNTGKKAAPSPCVLEWAGGTHGWSHLVGRFGQVRLPIRITATVRDLSQMLIEKRITSVRPERQKLVPRHRPRCFDADPSGPRQPAIARYFSTS